MPPGSRFEYVQPQPLRDVWAQRCQTPAFLDLNAYRAYSMSAQQVLASGWGLPFTNMSCISRPQCSRRVSAPDSKVHPQTNAACGSADHGSNLNLEPTHTTSTHTRRPLHEKGPVEISIIKKTFLQNHENKQIADLFYLRLSQNRSRRCREIIKNSAAPSGPSRRHVLP